MLLFYTHKNRAYMEFLDHYIFFFFPLLSRLLTKLLNFFPSSPIPLSTRTQL